MRYGLPYKGSKNSIAEWIIDNLPRAETFCDLFFGGGAVTHRALYDGKYKNFIINDIDARLPQLFLDCVDGKYTTANHPEWISREEFNARKQDDAYIALIWSFGNNGKDYLYGADIEEMKHAFHIACFENDISMLLSIGVKVKKSREKDIYQRYLDYSKQIKNFKHNMLENFTRLQALEHLQGLQSLQGAAGLQKIQGAQGLQNLQTYGGDYADVPIPEGSLIYCDIPYRGTICGKYDGFDHDRFYEWAEAQDNIYISEYEMPDIFVPYAWIEKQVLSSADSNSNWAKEKIYTNRKTFDKLSDFDKFRVNCNFAEQMTLF